MCRHASASTRCARYSRPRSDLPPGESSGVEFPDVEGRNPKRNWCRAESNAGFERPRSRARSPTANMPGGERRFFGGLAAKTDVTEGRSRAGGAFAGQGFAQSPDAHHCRGLYSSRRKSRSIMPDRMAVDEVSSKLARSASTRMADDRGGDASARRSRQEVGSRSRFRICLALRTDRRAASLHCDRLGRRCVALVRPAWRTCGRDSAMPRGADCIG